MCSGKRVCLTSFTAKTCDKRIQLLYSPETEEEITSSETNQQEQEQEQRKQMQKQNHKKNKHVFTVFGPKCS